MNHQFEALSRFSVATLQHCANGVGVLKPGFFLLWERSRDTPRSVVGTIRTVLTGPADNLAVHRMLKEIHPGDFLVIKSPCGGAAAIWGEVISRTAAARGAAGAVVDGGVRDSRGILAAGLPVWYRVRQPSTADKNEPGEMDLPLAVGGLLLRSGEVLVGDEDGLLRLRPDQISDVIDAAQAHDDVENEMQQHLLDGGSYEDFVSSTEPSDR